MVFAARTRYPHRWVRLLHRLWHQVTAWHIEPTSAKPGIRPHRQHVGGLLGRLLPHRPFFIGIDAKAAHLDRCCRFASSPFDAAIGYQIERRDALGDARRVVVFGGIKVMP